MKKIITPYRIKIICAFVLLACLTLPFSSCKSEFDENGTATYISKKPAVKTVVEYSYPLDLFKAHELLSWLFIYSFLWPIPILLYKHFGKRKKIKTIFWISETLFIIGSAYLLIRMTILSTPAIGEILALSANGGYGFTWLYELIRNIFIKSRLTTKTSRPEAPDDLAYKSGSGD